MPKTRWKKFAVALGVIVGATMLATAAQAATGPSLPAEYQEAINAKRVPATSPAIHILDLNGNTETTATGPPASVWTANPYHTQAWMPLEKQKEVRADANERVAAIFAAHIAICPTGHSLGVVMAENGNPATTQEMQAAVLAADIKRTPTVRSLPMSA